MTGMQMTFDDLRGGESTFAESHMPKPSHLFLESITQDGCHQYLMRLACSLITN